MASEWDGFLEGLARRMCFGLTGKCLGGDMAAAQFVLKESVLPLLKAGEKAVLELAPNAYGSHAALLIEYVAAREAALKGSTGA